MPARKDEHTHTHTHGGSNWHFYGKRKSGADCWRRG